MGSNPTPNTEIWAFLGLFYVHFQFTLSTFHRCLFGDNLRRQEDVFFSSAREGERVLSQNTLVKSLPSHVLLTLKMPNIDDLFPGFAVGDFALLQGTSAVLPLSLARAKRHIATAKTTQNKRYGFSYHLPNLLAMLK